MPDDNDHFTEDQLAALLTALGHGQGNFTEEEGVRLVEWASEVRTAAALLEGLLRGVMVVTLRRGDEPVFAAAPGPIERR